MDQEAASEPDVEFIDQFLANQAMIYGFLRSSIFDATDAEDVFQQVALTLWRKKDSYDPQRGNFRAWAIGVARNHMRNYVRQQSRDRRIQVFAPDVIDRIAEGRREIDERSLERQAALTRCVGKLPAADRERLEYFYGGSAPKQMAEDEGVSLRTYYRKLQKLRKLLMDCISKTLDAERGVHGRN